MFVVRAELQVVTTQDYATDSWFWTVFWWVIFPVVWLCASIFSAKLYVHMHTHKPCNLIVHTIMCSEIYLCMVGIIRKHFVLLLYIRFLLHLGNFRVFHNFNWFAKVYIKHNTVTSLCLVIKHIFLFINCFVMHVSWKILFTKETWFTVIYMFPQLQ